MNATINRAAKIPADLASMQQQFKLNYLNILSTNPKTEKSAVQTYILHLSPANTSGMNVCPGAGNCKKICLHFAGNPVYMTNKQAARIRRTLAYAADPQRFAMLIICAILDKINKNNGNPIAIRLNGTSDIVWEDLDFYISPEFATLCRIKFGHDLRVGKRNIFEVFSALSLDSGVDVTFYDYTKVRHNWAECKRLGYHLTFSFDGWDNSANLKIARDALRSGVKIAAAFNIKKGQPLPSHVRSERLMGDPDRVCAFSVYDGDLSDFRPSDPSDCAIIGLRFKLPHGIKYTEAEKLAFCFA